MSFSLAVCDPRLSRVALLLLKGRRVTFQPFLVHFWNGRRPRRNGLPDAMELRRLSGRYGSAADVSMAAEGVAGACRFGLEPAVSTRRRDSCPGRDAGRNGCICGIG